MFTQTDAAGDVKFVADGLFLLLVAGILILDPFVALAVVVAFLVRVTVASILLPRQGDAP